MSLYGYALWSLYSCVINCYLDVCINNCLRHNNYIDITTEAIATQTLSIQCLVVIVCSIFVFLQIEVLWNQLYYKLQYS